MGQMKILVVDDEPAVRRSVSMVFEREGMEVISAAGGQEALDILQTRQFDLIILDVMMGDMDGFYVVDIMRRKKIHTPVLFLSGNQEEQSKILGISMGGDDYLTKPFNMTMLLTKARALIRRSQEYDRNTKEELVAGDLKIDLLLLQVFRRGREIRLTSKEFSLLKFLMENPDQVFSKEQLYEKVWNNNAVDDNTIMVYIKRIRDKIEDDPKFPRYLKTVWGLGYKFEIF